MRIVIDAEREFWAAEATLHTFTKHAVQGVCQTCARIESGTRLITAADAMLRYITSSIGGNGE